MVKQGVQKYVHSCVLIQRYWKSKAFKKSAEMALLLKYWDDRKGAHIALTEAREQRLKDLNAAKQNGGKLPPQLAVGGRTHAKAGAPNPSSSVQAAGRGGSKGSGKAAGKGGNGSGGKRGKVLSKTELVKLAQDAKKELEDMPRFQVSKAAVILSHMNMMGSLQIGPLLPC